jgi:uncharacterized membrane protein
MASTELRSGGGRDELPFMAPCRQLEINAPFRWLKEGYADMRHAPWQSLLYGLIMALICMALGAMGMTFGGYLVPLAIMGGIVFLAPVLCLGLYAIAAQLERKQPAMLGRTFREAARRRLATELVFALMLLVVFLIWARAFSLIQVFMPENSQAGWQELLSYILVVVAVSGFFAAITFASSAFALPMIMHRDVDAITAAITSINAVLRNKKPMALWAGICLLTILIGIATGFIGAIFLWPLIGLATWHAYLDTIDASAFPRHAEGIASIPRFLD